MPYVDKIDALIETVRELNHQVRPKLSNVVGGGADAGQQAHALLGQMRDGELEAVLRIQAMVIGEQVGADQKYRNPIDQVGSRSLLSEFTTAREATLASLRDLHDPQWEEARETPNGTSSVVEVVDSLIESDKVAVARLEQFTGGVTPPQGDGSPQSTESPSTEPQSTEPQSTEPQSTEPQSTEPQSTEPQSTEPQSTEPQSTEPQSTEPQSAEPQSTE